MYHAQRSATGTMLAIVAVLCGLAVMAGAQGFDPDALTGALETSGVTEKLPAWALPLLLPVVTLVCGLISAFVSDEKLGRFSGPVNKLALNFGKARNDEQAQ